MHTFPTGFLRIDGTLCKIIGPIDMPGGTWVETEIYSLVHPDAKPTARGLVNLENIRWILKESA